MADDLTTQILRDYPSFSFLLNDPGLNDPATGVNILLEAVDPEKPFDAPTFQAKLLQTDWWKAHGAAARQWITLVSTDPATAQAQKNAWIAQVADLSSQYGLHLGSEQLNNWADFFLSSGVQANDPRVVDSIVNLYTAEPAFRSGDSGTISTIAGQARQLADTYMVDLSQGDYDYWSARIARGEATLQGFTEELKQLAMDRYSAYADRIQAGATPTQIFSQQRNAIAQELEIDPSGVDLMHDPRWSQVLGVNTDKGMRPMTYAETIGLARSQPEWRYTTGANTQAADLATRVLSDFGAIK